MKYMVFVYSAQKSFQQEDLEWQGFVNNMKETIESKNKKIEKIILKQSDKINQKIDMQQDQIKNLQSTMETLKNENQEII